MFRRTVSALVAIVVLLTWAANADAQIAALSDETLNQVRGLAEAAKAQFPTDPERAAKAFRQAFDKDFKGVTRQSLNVYYSEALTISAQTPLETAHTLFTVALNKMEELPDDPVGRDSVKVFVYPKQMGSPDVSKCSLYRDDQEVAATANLLAPTEFKNRMGAAVTVHAGSIDFPVEAFAPGAVVKIICIVGSSPISREWKPKDLERLK